MLKKFLVIFIFLMIYHVQSQNADNVTFLKESNHLSVDDYKQAEEINDIAVAVMNAAEDMLVEWMAKNWDNLEYCGKHWIDDPDECSKKFEEIMQQYKDLFYIVLQSKPLKKYALSEAQIQEAVDKLTEQQKAITEKGFVIKSKAFMLRNK